MYNWEEGENLQGMYSDGVRPDRSNSLPVSFRRSSLETIHSEEATPRGSVSQDELLSVLATKDQLDLSPPNPGLVIQSTKPESACDSRIEIKPTLEVAVQEPHRKKAGGRRQESFPSQAAVSDRSASLPPLSRQINQLRRPASGDYDRQVALFEDLMGSSSELDMPSFSQVLPGEGCSETPSLSRSVKTALIGKVDFGHAFSQTQHNTLPDITAGAGSKGLEENGDACLDALYEAGSGLSTVLTEDEFQTPQASPVVLRRHYNQPQGNSGSTQGTVTPQASPSEVRRTLTEETSPELLLPLPLAPLDTSSSFTSSTASDTTVVFPCPSEFAAESPPSSESNTGSVSPNTGYVDKSRDTPEKLEVEVKSDHSSSPSNSRKDKDTKSKNQESSSSTLSKFKPFSAVRRVHSFSQTRRKQRPISVIGLVHTTRDNSDLLDLDAAIRLKRMTGERQSPPLTGRESPLLLGRGGGSEGGSPVVPEVSDLPSVKVSLTPSSGPHRSISLRDTTLDHQLMNERSSPDGASSPDFSSATSSATNRSPRTIRWSLLRSNHKQKLQIAEEKLAEEVVPHQSSPLPSSDDKDQAKVEEKLLLKEALAKCEPQQAGKLTDKEEERTGGSLFYKPEEDSGVARRKGRGRKKKDKHRSLTIAGTEMELASLEEQQKSGEQRPYKVLQLAREYSRKIKERRLQQKTSSTATAHEERKQDENPTGHSLSLSQTHLSTFDVDNSQTPPTSPSPEWLREHGPTHNQPLCPSKALSTTDLPETAGSRLDSPLPYSDGERTPRGDTPLGLSEQTNFMRKEGLPASIPELPRTNLPVQKSFTIARFTSVADEMMMQGREVEEKKKGRVSGWVRSFVNRFSSSGK